MATSIRSPTLKLSNHMEYTFTDYLDQCFPHPPECTQLGIRRGQRMADMLRESKPYLHRQAQNADVSPFYDDAKIPAFLAYVGTRWDSMV